MTNIERSSVANILLSALPSAALTRIIEAGKRVDLKTGEIISTAGEPITHLCFPEGGIASYTDGFGTGRIEIGLIGREGFTGWPLLLGCEQSAHQAQVQIGHGTAIRIESATLLQICEAHPHARMLMLQFVHSFIAQMGRTIVSNLVDPIQKRLARWILMCHDRSTGDEIALTHEYMAVMLGVRRASVTDSLHVLEGEGAISGKRRLVVIRDRAKLEQIAGECYGPAEAGYRKQIDPKFGKSR